MLEETEMGSLLRGSPEGAWAKNILRGAQQKGSMASTPEDSEGLMVRGSAFENIKGLPGGGSAPKNVEGLPGGGSAYKDSAGLLVRGSASENIEGLPPTRTVRGKEDTHTGVTQNTQSFNGLTEHLNNHQRSLVIFQMPGVRDTFRCKCHL